MAGSRIKKYLKRKRFFFKRNPAGPTLAQLLTMYQFCFLYMLHYPVMYSLSERERVAVNMQGTVFTLARLQIVPSYHQELVSHPMPEHIEALS